MMNLMLLEGMILRMIYLVKMNLMVRSIYVVLLYVYHVNVNDVCSKVILGFWICLHSNELTNA
jgi:hypothetical protein